MGRWGVGITIRAPEETHDPVSTIGAFPRPIVLHGSDFGEHYFAWVTTQSAVPLYAAQCKSVNNT